MLSAVLVEQLYRHRASHTNVFGGLIGARVRAASHATSGAQPLSALPMLGAAPSRVCAAARGAAPSRPPVALLRSARGRVRVREQRGLRGPELLTRAQPQTTAAAATPASTLPAKNEDVTVLVLGPTGYIGRSVTKELIARGYKVRVRRLRGAARPRSRCSRWWRSRARRAALEARRRRRRRRRSSRGRTGWRLGTSRRAARAARPGCSSLQPQSVESLRATAFAEKVDVVVSCLASRTGGIQARAASHAASFSALSACARTRGTLTTRPR